MATYYEVLGVSPSASPDDIKRAYRKLSFTHHPDKNASSPDSTTLFQKIAEAYSVLSDAETRGDYDNELKYGGSGKGSRQMHARMPNPHDLFNMLFGGLGNVGGGGGGGGSGGGGGIGHILQNLSEMGMGMGMGMRMGMIPGEIHIIHGGCGANGVHPMMAHMQNMQFVHQPHQQQHQQPHQPPHQQPHQSQDEQHRRQDSEPIEPELITLTISATLEQVYFGEGVQVEYDRVIYETPTISSIKRESITIAIPRGVHHKEKLVVPNIGNVNAHGRCGSLQITFSVEPHPVFERDSTNNDIILHKTITLKESLCGVQFEFTHLNGKTFQIVNKNPGTVIQPEAIKIIKGLGFERNDGTGTGPQMGSLRIVFHVVYPESIGPELYDALSTIL